MNPIFRFPGFPRWKRLVRVGIPIALLLILGVNTYLKWIVIDAFRENKIVKSDISIPEYDAAIIDQEKELYIKQILGKEVLNTSAIPSTLDLARKASAWLKAHPNPNVPNTVIPKIIHQTWKTHNLSPYSVQKNSVENWSSEHPDYIYLLWDDDDAIELVRTYFPEIFPVYMSLQRKVMRADLFRYLALLQFGGIYSDVDTFALRNVNNWVEDQDLKPWIYINETNLMDFSKSPVTLIAGVAADVIPEKEKDMKPFTSPLEMVQWTFASTKHNPVVIKCVESVVAAIKSKSDGIFNDYDVVDTTGPGPWTRALHKYWKDNGVDAMKLRDWGQRSRQINEQMIFPLSAFAPNSTPLLSLGAKGIDSPVARVHHHWTGTWLKKD